MKAQRGKRGIALLNHNLVVRQKSMVNFMLWPLFLWQRIRVPIEVEAGWVPEPVWMCFEMRQSPAVLELCSFQLVALL
jgi:hypothetical protein